MERKEIIIRYIINKMLTKMDETQLTIDGIIEEDEEGVKAIEAKLNLRGFASNNLKDEAENVRGFMDELYNILELLDEKPL